MDRHIIQRKQSCTTKPENRVLRRGGPGRAIGPLQLYSFPPEIFRGPNAIWKAHPPRFRRVPGRCNFRVPTGVKATDLADDLYRFSKDDFRKLQYGNAPPEERPGEDARTQRGT